MGVIDDPIKLLYTAVGFLLFWAGSVIVKRVNDSTERRRTEIDKRAAVETYARRLSEALHEHRVMMIQSGHWGSDELPPFPGKND